MLDKSVPFIPFTMCRPSKAPSLAKIKLPEGYRFAFYQPGDEQAWCRIETAVLEFETETDAAVYFKKTSRHFLMSFNVACSLLKIPKEKKSQLLPPGGQQKKPRAYIG